MVALVGMVLLGAGLWWWWPPAALMGIGGLLVAMAWGGAWRRSEK